VDLSKVQLLIARVFKLDNASDLTDPFVSDAVLPIVRYAHANLSALTDSSTVKTSLRNSGTLLKNSLLQAGEYSLLRMEEDAQKGSYSIVLRSNAIPSRFISIAYTGSESVKEDVAVLLSDITEITFFERSREGRFVWFLPWPSLFRNLPKITWKDGTSKKHTQDMQEVDARMHVRSVTALWWVMIFIFILSLLGVANTFVTGIAMISVFAIALFSLKHWRLCKAQFAMIGIGALTRVWQMFG
jgi:hypothetical protein